jgi:dTDP-4-amino-4,6-dideoxygalactose transaminase
MGIAPSDLAVNGGEPVRTEPFPPWPHFEEEEKRAVRAVLDSDDVNYHRGECGITFERRFAEWVGVRHGLAVTNGGAALQCAVAASGAGPGDEVIVPAHTYVASDLAAVWAGATPVFADCERATLNVSAATVEPLVTDRTRAMIAVHMYGRPCDMDGLMALAEERGITLIEDCAQSHGATYDGRRTGAIGHIAAFSFCQTKHMTTGGEGGMVVTDDLELARLARAEAHYGTLYEAPDEDGRWKGVTREPIVGYNLRMTEMQSAIGLAILDRLDDYVAKRRELAAFLTEGLADTALNPVPAGDRRTHSYFRYDTLFDEDAADLSRDEYIRAVSAEGVPISTGSSFTNHQDPRFGVDASCPVSEEMGRRIVTLEVYPTIGRSDCDDVLAAIRKVEAAYAG